MKPLSIPYLKPSTIAKATKSFDKASGLIVIVMWGAAVIFCGLAYLSIGQTIQARQQLAEADAALPVLPTIQRDDPADGVLMSVAARLEKRHGDKLQISITAGKLQIAAKAADSYATWISAISYVDTLAPEITWTIDTMCVGQECKGNLMTVQLAAKKVSFAAPQALD